MKRSLSASVRHWATITGLAVIVLGCGDDDSVTNPVVPQPDNAPRASIDRFSDAAGTLFRRSAMPSLPGPNQAINLDQGPFITHGLGPAGQRVRYYNFDRMPVEPAPIYVLFRAGETQPVSGQLNVVDAIPGDLSYSDFWQVIRVTVPQDYVANTITSRAQIITAGYQMQETTTLVNCPIVPEGSTASEGDGADGLTRGWYRGQVVFYFNFGEAPLTTTSGGEVPRAPIFVAFNINPDQQDGGPPSGFRTEAGTAQTHNVVGAIPGQAGYSPLWLVVPYDNVAFSTVRDLPTAQAAQNFGVAAIVNCPIVFVEP